MKHKHIYVLWIIAFIIPYLIAVFPKNNLPVPPAKFVFYFLFLNLPIVICMHSLSNSLINVQKSGKNISLILGIFWLPVTILFYFVAFQINVEFSILANYIVGLPLLFITFFIEYYIVKNYNDIF